jgi:2-hydroxychromene-2-carboxylate isomerase
VSRPLEFWFEFASTYSYPAAMRVEEAARGRGVELVWRPFLLGPIFAAQGWNDSPFNLYPAKGDYMWRDLERVCAALGLPLVRPSVFPRNGLRAARVACAHEGEPWVPGFVRGVYTASFAHDRDPADPDVLAEVLEAVGQPAGAALARADDEQSKTKLRRRTQEAARHGIFGAPSFRVDGELYWGNDRLEMALDHAAR